MDPLGASAQSGLSLLLTGPYGNATVNRCLEDGGLVFVLLATSPSPRKFTLSPASLSGSNAKNPSMKLATLALDEVEEFDVANATVVVS
jgi:hypothetical protein